MLTLKVFVYTIVIFFVLCNQLLESIGLQIVHLKKRKPFLLDINSFSGLESLKEVYGILWVLVPILILVLGITISVLAIVSNPARDKTKLPIRGINLEKQSGYPRTNYFSWKHSSNEFPGNFYSQWNIQNCNQSNIAKRGYWQELIETLAWAHERTPLANLIRWRDKPVALSIVQARLVGLVHFSVGYIFTYAAFLIASTSGNG